MTEPQWVTEPGVYDMPADVYLSDPVPGGSLSSTGARKLLPPGCPAAFRWWVDHPEPPRKTFDLGHAAHRLVLGAGPELTVIAGTGKAGPEVWATNADKAAVAAARAAGQVPLHPSEHDQVQAMAKRLREHEYAPLLFEVGQPEQSLFWQDRATGVWCRARLDWLMPATGPGGVVYVSDYKTTESAHPDSIRQTIWKYGYHQQAAWYCDAVKALGLAKHAVFFLVCQEKTPPHLVTVVQLDPAAERIGRDLNREALEIYRDCAEANQWPGYAAEQGGMVRICLPAWVERQHMPDLW